MWMLIETRRDGGVWGDRYPTRRIAEQNAERARQFHKGRTYEVREEFRTNEGEKR